MYIDELKKNTRFQNLSPFALFVKNRVGQTYYLQGRWVISVLVLDFLNFLGLGNSKMWNDYGYDMVMNGYDNKNKWSL